MNNLGIINQPSGAPTLPTQRPFRTRKAKLFIWLAIILGFIVMVAAVAAYVFLVHIPNKPENVYRRGLGSVGAGMQYLITPEFLSDVASTKYSGELTVDYAGDYSDVDFRLGLDGQYDPDNALFNADASFKYDEKDTGSGSGDSFSGSLDMNAIFIGPQEGIAPKLYMRFNALDLPDEYEQAIDEALVELMPDKTLDGLVGGWLLLDFQEFIEAGVLTNEDLSSVDLDQDISQEDYQEVILLLADNLSEYIFTADTEMMVFEMNEFLGEEDFKGSPAKKYSVTFNQENAKAFVTSLRDDLDASEVWEKIASSEGFDFDLTEELSDKVITEMVEEFNADTAVEIWVDSKTKVLRNLRFTQKDGNEGYGDYWDLGVDLKEDGLAVSIEVASYGSIYSCEEYYSSFYEEDIFSDTKDPEDNDCPYVFGAAGSDCGEAPEYGGFTKLGSEHDYDAYLEAQEEYDGCKRPQVVALKEGIEPEIISLTLDLDTVNNQIDYRFEAAISGFNVKFTITVAGQSGAIDVQPPEDYQLLFDSSTFDQLQINSSNNNRRADLSGLRAQMEVFISNNNGRLPDASQFENDVIPSWYAFSYAEESVSYEVAFPDELTDYFLPNQDQIHVFAGASCGREIMSNDANTADASDLNRYTADDLETGNSRALAFVYTLEGETKPRCEDNL